MQLISDRSRSAMRILCISPFYAPAANSEAFCGAKMVAALRDAGADVQVICCSNVQSEKPAVDDSSMWHPLQAGRHDVHNPGGDGASAKAAAALKFQTAVYARWVEGAVRKAQALHAEKKFDLIYSRSFPMCAHIAGYWASKRLGLPWIANINDPWESTFSEGSRASESMLVAKTYRHWLKRTLSGAALVTYPCQRLARFHQKVSGIQHRSLVLPHIGTSAPDASTDGLFRLVHAGKLGSSEFPPRPAEPFLQGLRSFVNECPEAAQITRLLLVGPSDESTNNMVRELGLDGVVESTGRVSYERSLEHMASAAVCVLIEALVEEGIFLPSKLTDYVACRKPVLCLSPKTGTASDMAHEQCIRYASPTDPVAIKQVLLALFDQFKKDHLKSFAPRSEFRQQFEAETVAMRFLDAARALTASSEHELSRAEKLPAASHSDELYSASEVK